MLCQLSYRGRQPRDCSRVSRAASRAGSVVRAAKRMTMRRFAVVGVAVFIGVLVFAPSGLAASARVAALQVGLRAHGFDAGPVDGVRGPQTTNALLAFQRARGHRRNGSGRTRDETSPRRTRPATSGPTRARGRRRGMGRRGARVPPSALRSRPPRGGRQVHSENECGADALPESPRTCSGRDRGAEDVPLARGADDSVGHMARRPAGRELLLDRGALPREPVAARAPESPLADARDRAESAARASEGRAAGSSSECRPSRES